MDDSPPISQRPADLADEDPPPELESSEGATHYYLPRQWSLSYALTKKQWRDFRERQKALDSDWTHCKCPKRCNAKTLDEKWKYDRARHTKSFISAAFICGGCHWLKTPPFRIKTWLELEDSVVPSPSKSPHIIDCLGWTQQRLDALRDSDLKTHRAQARRLARLNREVQQGIAAIVPAPPDRLSPQELEKLVRPGQIMVVPWRIDLSGLTRYGYEQNQIVVFEKRMYDLAAKRMAGDDDSALRGWG